MGDDDDCDMDTAIDGETVDLFAVMNSGVVELQMELELLENKEYLKDDNSSNNHHLYPPSSSSSGKDTATKNSSQSPTENNSRTIIPVRDPSSSKNPLQPVITAAATMGSETLASAKPTAVQWQRLVPAQVGEPDYAPLADYSPVPPAQTLQPAQVGDADYAPVSDYTRLPNVMVALEPAKVGDQDYVPVADYTSTAATKVGETSANVAPSKPKSTASIMRL